MTSTRRCAAGKEVWVFSARAGHEGAPEAIKAWTKEHIGQELPVTNIKYPEFATFVDDRAQQPEHMGGAAEAKPAAKTPQQVKDEMVGDAQAYREALASRKKLTAEAAKTVNQFLAEVDGVPGKYKAGDKLSEEDAHDLDANAEGLEGAAELRDKPLGTPGTLAAKDLKTKPNGIQKCGDEVRELLHDGCPTACLGDAAFGYVVTRIAG